jgi:hypothetical protein
MRKQPKLNVVFATAFCAELPDCGQSKGHTTQTHPTLATIWKFPDMSRCFPARTSETHCQRNIKEEEVEGRHKKNKEG